MRMNASIAMAIAIALADALVCIASYFAVGNSPGRNLGASGASGGFQKTHVPPMFKTKKPEHKAYKRRGLTMALIQFSDTLFVVSAVVV